MSQQPELFSVWLTPGVGVCPENCSSPGGSYAELYLTLCLAVGKPIEVQKILNPSQEQVDKLHELYIKELCNLFEAHKLKYNVPADQHLEFR